MKPNKPTIGIYLIRFPALSETFIVSKILGLLDAGFDIQIFAEVPSSDWDYFEGLRAYPEFCQRIHIAPPSRPLGRLLSEGLPYLLGKAIRYPIAFTRYVAHCWRYRHSNPLGFLKAVYARLMFVGHSVDLLHIEFDTQALGIADMKRYLGCKLLLGSRTPFHLTSVLGKYPDALRYLYELADGYHFVSKALQDEARLNGLPDRVRIVVIHPAIDLTLFKPPEQKIDAQVFRIISIGRLAAGKGYELNLEAVAQVHRASVDLRYTIIGDGPERSDLESLAKDLGLLDARLVEFAGAQRREAIPSYLAQADVLLHLSHFEGLSNATLEAQAMGIPVISSNVGGQHEAVEDGVTGFMVPHGSSTIAAEKLILLANDSALRRGMGAAGRARIEATFALDAQIRAFTELYQTLINS
jgi:colanic acid/amylovoran biosynthesis glycosyltransferase